MVLNWPNPASFEFENTDKEKFVEVEVHEEENLHETKNSTKMTSEEDFIKIFAIPLIIVIFFLFLFSCCLFCVFKKIMTNYLGQDESQEEDVSLQGEIDIVQQLKRIRNMEQRQIKMIELIELLF